MGTSSFPGLININGRPGDYSQLSSTPTQGVSQKALASQFNKGKATIERWYHKQYHEQARERMNRPCPQVLGRDEHSFSRKGQGFATTFCDLRKHKVFEVVKGRCEKELAGYLETLSGRDRVRVVCIDLSSTYRALIKKYFPNAMIVADRFHVIRLMNHLNLKTYQQIDPDTKYQRGILNVLKTKPDRLSASAKMRCAAYLEQNPAIAAVYAFKQTPHTLLSQKHCTENVQSTSARFFRTCSGIETVRLSAPKNAG